MKWLLVIYLIGTPSYEWTPPKIEIHHIGSYTACEVIKDWTQIQLSKDKAFGLRSRIICVEDKE